MSTRDLLARLDAIEETLRYRRPHRWLTNDELRAWAAVQWQRLDAGDVPAEEIEDTADLALWAATIPD